MQSFIDISMPKISFQFPVKHKIKYFGKSIRSLDKNTVHSNHCIALLELEKINYRARHLEYPFKKLSTQ